MERISATSPQRQPPIVTSQTVETLLGASAARHVLYLLDGQYLYQSQAEDGSIRYKFLSPQAVRLAFSHEPVDSGWLNPGICRWGYNRLGQWAIMFIPPAVHTLWLPTAWVISNMPGPVESPGTGEGLLAAQVPLPGLIFAGAGRHYYLWAVKSREFNSKLTLFHAPLPNVYENGQICWGSNQVGPVTPQNLKEIWQLFISSPFNTHLSASKSKRYGTNILDQLANLWNKKRKTYPVNDLLPFPNSGYRQGEGLTIGVLVDQLIATMERTVE